MPEFQVAVPCDGHENIGKQEQKYCVYAIHGYVRLGGENAAANILLAKTFWRAWLLLPTILESKNVVA